MGVSVGWGEGAFRAAEAPEARRREAERTRVKVAEYSDEIGGGTRAMRNGGMKNHLMGIGGFFPGG